jgi:pimeloyl-ACP methyl ester carboxylesterase
MNTNNFDFSSIDLGGENSLPHESFTARDGKKLYYRSLLSPEKSSPILILIHGSAGNSEYFQNMAVKISQEAIAHVYTPDMRGHGYFPERRGDIDYIGQLEDDLHDFIVHIKKELPTAKIILGGHSSGAGFALKYATGKYNKDVERLLLLAPYLGHDTPMVRKDFGYASPHLARFIFLKIINRLGITSFNSWKVLTFNIPEQFLNPSITTKYSFRMTETFQTDDYQKDFAKLNKLTLLLVGSKDEASITQNFEPVIKQITRNVIVQIVNDHNHINLVTEANINSFLQEWLYTK